MKKGVDYIGVAVGAVIVNREGKILMGLRGRAVRNEAGKWECPGGGVDFGEKLEDTVVREALEEFGITVKVVELLGVCDHFIPGEHQHWVSPVYLCTLESGEPKILEPTKCVQFGWFTLDECMKMDTTIATKLNWVYLLKKYPERLPDLYR